MACHSWQLGSRSSGRGCPGTPPSPPPPPCPWPLAAPSLMTSRPRSLLLLWRLAVLQWASCRSGTRPPRRPGDAGCPLSGRRCWWRRRRAAPRCGWRRRRGGCSRGCGQGNRGYWTCKPENIFKYKNEMYVNAYTMILHDAFHDCNRCLQWLY